MSCKLRAVLNLPLWCSSLIACALLAVSPAPMLGLASAGQQAGSAIASCGCSGATIIVPYSPAVTSQTAGRSSLLLRCWRCWALQTQAAGESARCSVLQATKIADNTVLLTRSCTANVLGAQCCTAKQGGSPGHRPSSSVLQAMTVLNMPCWCRVDGHAHARLMCWVLEVQRSN